MSLQDSLHAAARTRERDRRIKLAGDSLGRRLTPSEVKALDWAMELEARQIKRDLARIRRKTVNITSVGAVLAVVVLILAIVLAVVGQLPWMLAGLLAALALARLL